MLWRSHSIFFSRGRVALQDGLLLPSLFIIHLSLIILSISVPTMLIARRTYDQPSGGGRHEGVEDAANLADTVGQIAPLLDRA